MRHKYLHSSEKKNKNNTCEKAKKKLEILSFLASVLVSC